MSPSDRDVEVRRICEELRAFAAARAVVLTDGAGRVLAQAGFLSPSPLLPRALPHEVARSASPLSPIDEPRSYDLGEGRKAYCAPVGKVALLTIAFDLHSSLGLVRLRAQKAIEQIEPLLASEPGAGPIGGADSGGEGGAPAQVFAGHVGDGNN